MSKRTWSLLLFVIAAAGLLILKGCSNDVGNGGEAVFSFPGELIAMDAAGDSFTMGDGTYGPGVSQTISYNFKISKTEITNSQFQQFIDDSGYNTDSYWTTNGWEAKISGGWTQPAYWTDASFNGTTQPVVGVSWYEAVAFCNWLSVKEGLTPAYNILGQANLVASGYRLPTEVEWEYAAAKGASAEAERLWAYGGSVVGDWDSSMVVCSVSPASATIPANVGSKSPDGDTPQGLADMSGNVLEWCSDCSQDDADVSGGLNRYYFVYDQTDQLFIERGGAWWGIVEGYFRAAHRTNHDNVQSRYYGLGFRVVRP